MIQREWIKPYSKRAWISSVPRISSWKSSSGYMFNHSTREESWIRERTQIIRDKIEGLGVILDLAVKSREVEAVEDEVLLDLAEVLVALARQEPRDPLTGQISLLHIVLEVFRKHYRTTP